MENRELKIWSYGEPFLGYNIQEVRTGYKADINIFGIVYSLPVRPTLEYAKREAEKSLAILKK